MKHKVHSAKERETDNMRDKCIVSQHVIVFPKKSIEFDKLHFLQIHTVTIVQLLLSGKINTSAKEDKDVPKMIRKANLA